MIKEYCNLLGEKVVLVIHFKVNVVHEKKTFSPLKIKLISHSELLIM